MFERPGIQPSIGRNAERKDQIGQLAQFIESLAIRYRNEFDLPVDNEGRIDMAAYGNLYNNALRNTRSMHNWDAPDQNPRDIRQAQMTTDGERLEMLTVACLAKGLGPPLHSRTHFASR